MGNPIRIPKKRGKKKEERKRKEKKEGKGGDGKERWGKKRKEKSEKQGYPGGEDVSGNLPRGRFQKKRGRDAISREASSSPSFPPFRPPRTRRGAAMKRPGSVLPARPPGRSGFSGGLPRQPGEWRRGFRRAPQRPIVMAADRPLAAPALPPGRGARPHPLPNRGPRPRPEAFLRPPAGDG